MQLETADSEPIEMTWLCLVRLGRAQTLEAASNLFLPYGDIARMDMTLGATTGRILVTYFDIRSAQRVLEAFPGAAELFPPAEIGRAHV